MLKRPKPSDTEQDVLDMVKEYEAEKTKNTGFQPAAKLVKVNKRMCEFMVFKTI